MNVISQSPHHRWRFIQHRQGGKLMWLWQRFGADGRLEETSEPQKKYGEALLDAIKHGFRPKTDSSSVDLMLGSMHFPSGRSPVYEEIAWKEGIHRSSDSVDIHTRKPRP
jgi:hypothetical protein